MSDRKEFFSAFKKEAAKFYLRGFFFCVVFVAHVIAVLYIIQLVGCYWSLLLALASTLAAGAFLYLKKHGEI